MADSGNMISVLSNFPKMIEEASKLGDDITLAKDLIDKIVVSGMGGSGFTGDLLKVYMEDSPIPITVVKDYSLPAFADKKTLVIAISYSGNTEETISAYRSALRRGCKLVSISSGGKLEELSKMNKVQHIKIPGGFQPRLTTPYLFTAVINMLNAAGILDDQEKAIKMCIKEMSASGKKVEASGKEIAKKLKGKLPLIYSSQRMFAVAEKWKTDINENAKTHAFYNVLPEFNHNEICAFENQGLSSHVLLLSDPKDHEKVKKRIEIFKKLTAQYKVPVTEVGIVGENFLTRLMTSVWMGLFSAYYLALENGVDPTPVKIIEQLKKELA
ncbi:MAG: bifunctional phosphoglucose/phosphomannose isomerase [Nanoarchaeota archaeon]|nr:bifunctional phosphoglucose/phosphomannose isomerase [Nanoarchaeota archaeon]